jgi:predicted TIM-barrel fold metal-dependent hydrolase
VYADCSGFVYGGFKAHHRKLFRQYWERFMDINDGNCKILFGTDWPISDHRPYVDLVTELAGKHRDKVFHGNAEMLFGLAKG